MKTSYKVVVFDLDGTLTDSKVGIANSIRYAFRRLSIKEPNNDEVLSFLGPPLHESFSRYASLSGDTLTKAVDLYREYFRERGMFENEVYSGVTTLLSDLRQTGHRLAVATSKAETFAEQILQHFQLRHYFDCVSGSSLDNSKASKTDVLLAVFPHFGHYAREDFVMVGDREHDIIGAHNVGIDSIGVTYGYGSRQELVDSGAGVIVDSPTELASLLLKRSTPTSLGDRGGAVPKIP